MKQQVRNEVTIRSKTTARVEVTVEVNNSRMVKQKTGRDTSTGEKQQPEG